VVAAGLALGARATGALDALERSTVDERFQIRGGSDPPPDIVLVSLDSRSLARLNQRPPIPREIHAQLLDRLAGSDPKLIAYDFQFVGRTNPESDNTLIEAVENARPVLLATHFADPPLRVPAGAEDPDELGALLGSVTLLNDADGKIRRIPYATGGIRSFSVLAAETISGEKVDKDEFPALIDYRGGPGHFKTYSFSSVLDGNVPADAFRDKLVIVGSGDPIEKDVFPTPTDDIPMPGMEIHANSVATILDGFGLHDSSTALDTLLILLLSAIPALAGARFSPLRSLAIALVTLGLFLVAAQLLFRAGTLIDVAYPVLALTASSIGSLGVGFFTETRERLKMRRVFSRFVPDSVIDDVMQRADADLRLGGTTLDGTVLFCDLRGFTSFAESRPGAEVIATLNQYLGGMSDAILAHGGTVVSYMGDGIMAVFGAPIEQDDHADRAVAAAREMLETRLPVFNDWFSAQGHGDGFRMGIGLASGSIASGNVGSERRIEYAAVGDTTNIAARLESKTKDTPYQLLLSQATRDRLRSIDGLAPAGEFVLKGRSEPTAVWTLAQSSPGSDGGGGAAGGPP
jgi:adenylate cyclase